MKSKPFVLLAALVLSSYSIPTVKAQTQTRNGAVIGGVAGAVIGGVIGHQNKETPEGALIGGAVGAVAGGLIGNQQQKLEQERAQRRYYEQQQWQRSHSVGRPGVVYGQPVYGQPVYSQPVYGQPVYGQPVYGTPVYGTPVYSTPGYIVPGTTIVSQSNASPSTTTKVTTKRPLSINDVVTLSKRNISEGVILKQIQTNGVLTSPSVDDVLDMSESGVSDRIISAMQEADVIESNGYSTSNYARSQRTNEGNEPTLAKPPATSFDQPQARSASVPQSRLKPVPSQRRF